MKLLALPKSEVDIIPDDTSLEIKTFTYYLGNPYPSERMAKYIAFCNYKCKKKVRVFSPLVEFTREEYQTRINEREKFIAISQQSEILPKEDIVLDNYKFEDCFIKQATPQEDGTYHCEISFRTIVQLNHDS